MTEDINTLWYRALTLAERAAIIHPIADGFNALEARNRLQEWRSQLQVEQSRIFTDRLAQDGLPEETFLPLAWRGSMTPPSILTVGLQPYFL